MNSQKASVDISKYENHDWNKLDFLWLEITSKCNLKCIHCYADSSPFNPLDGKMRLSDWVKVLEDGYELGCRKVQFIGGEPTLHPELLCMIKTARSIGYNFIEVYTNGTLINNSMIALFKEEGVNLAFSVYSLEPTTHNQITERHDSFRKTIESIQKTLLSGLNIRVGITVMEENSKDIQRTIEFLKNLGVKNIGTDIKRGIGRGNEIDQEKTDPIKQLCGNCWKGQLVVDANGDVFPCVFSRFNILGSAREGLKEILENDMLTDFRRKIYSLSNSHPRKNPCNPNQPCQPNVPCNPNQPCSPNKPCHPNG